MSKVARRFSREMKLAAVLRMLAGENVSALARELKLRRKLLYEWRDNFRLGGPEALRSPGRPRKSPWIASSEAAPSPAAPADTLAQAQRRVAEQEREIGPQQVELDFLLYKPYDK